MPSSPTWIWQHSDSPHFSWDEARLAPFVARARLAQGKVLGANRFLDAGLTLEGVATILAEDGLTTSAIEPPRNKIAGRIVLLGMGNVRLFGNAKSKLGGVGIAHPLAGMVGDAHPTRLTPI
jgi:hypothetical protein